MEGRASCDAGSCASSPWSALSPSPLTDGELYAIIRDGIRLSGMPAWGEPGVEDDEESWALVAFIRHLPR